MSIDEALFLLDMLWIILIFGSAVLIINPGIRVKKQKLPKGKTYEDVIKARRTEGIICLILAVLFLLFL